MPLCAFLTVPSENTHISFSPRAFLSRGEESKTARPSLDSLVRELPPSEGPSTRRTPPAPLSEAPERERVGVKKIVLLNTYLFLNHMLKAELSVTAFEPHGAGAASRQALRCARRPTRVPAGACRAGLLVGRRVSLLYPLTVSDLMLKDHIPSKQIPSKRHCFLSSRSRNFPAQVLSSRAACRWRNSEPGQRSQRPQESAQCDLRRRLAWGAISPHGL